MPLTTSKFVESLLVRTRIHAPSTILNHVIAGQILVGVIGDWLGRRCGLIQDSVIMFLGLVMLTAAWGTTQNGWVICYVWSLFFYGTCKNTFVSTLGS
jgi:hypothetical protein